MSASRYYLDIIDRAIETAPWQTAPDDFTSPYLASFADKPDDFVIPVNTVWEIRPGQAIIEDTSEFSQLYAALGSRTGLAYSPSDIDLIARHEGQHNYAARTLGAINSVFGVMLENAGPKETPVEARIRVRAAFHASIDFRTSKLGHALIYAHPLDESLGDMQNISDLGYKSVAEIGQKAVTHNSQYGYELPVPLGYSIDTSLSGALRSRTMLDYSVAKHGH